MPEITRDDIESGAQFSYPDGTYEIIFKVVEDRGVVLTTMEQDIETLVEYLNASNADPDGVNEFVQELDVEQAEELIDGPDE